MKLSTLAFILVGVLSSNVSAQETSNAKYPDKRAYYGNIQYGYIGCFNKKGGLKPHSNDGFMTNGKCREECKPEGYKYAGTSKNGQCWCGNQLPPKDAIQDNKVCDKECQGYGEEPCMNDKFQLIWTDLLTLSFPDRWVEQGRYNYNIGGHDGG